jgi:ribose transport system substrate-binding protein
VQEAVDLVIEFQTDQHCASIVSSTLLEAGIRSSPSTFPIPGARYYGANNYRAGILGGRHLAQVCQQKWRGKVDEVLLLELPMAGQLPRSRLYRRAGWHSGSAALSAEPTRARPEWKWAV